MLIEVWHRPPPRRLARCRWPRPSQRHGPRQLSPLVLVPATCAGAASRQCPSASHSMSHRRLRRHTNERVRGRATASAADRARMPHRRRRCAALGSAATHAHAALAAPSPACECTASCRRPGRGRQRAAARNAARARRRRRLCCGGCEAPRQWRTNRESRATALHRVRLPVDEHVAVGGDALQDHVNEDDD